METQSENQQEKRRYPRYAAREGVLVTFRDASVKVASVINMSMGGLAFQYITRESTIGGSLELSTIIGGNPGCRLTDIPCRVAYNREVFPMEKDLAVRCCGVEFGDLSLEMTRTLASLLTSCTLGFPPDAASA